MKNLFISVILCLMIGCTNIDNTPKKIIVTNDETNEIVLLLNDSKFKYKLFTGNSGLMGIKDTQSNEIIWIGNVNRYSIVVKQINNISVDIIMENTNGG